jgi:uncharacterized membrane protein
MNPRFFYATALTGFFGLFSLLMLWHTVLATSHSGLPVALLLLLTVAPLLLPMRGLLKQNHKSCAWAAYLSLFYFIHGCQEAYANPIERVYASLEVLFSLMLFFGATFYIRFAKKHC